MNPRFFEGHLKGMRSGRIKLLLLAAALAAAALWGFGAAGRPPVREASPRLSAAEFRRVIEEIVRAAPAGQATPFLHWALAFVHENSMHRIDQEYQGYAFNIPYVLTLMLQASRDSSASKPHLSCGPRALALQAILSVRNLTSRPVQFFSDNFETVQGHRLLEVMNPDSQRWELWDPDFGVIYVNKDTGERLNAGELLRASDLSKIEPQGRGKRGWAETGTAILRDHYFRAVLFEQIPRGMRNAIIEVNREKFDLHKRFKDGRTFEEFARGAYGEPRFVGVKVSNPSSLTAPAEPR